MSDKTTKLNSPLQGGQGGPGQREKVAYKDKSDINSGRARKRGGGKRDTQIGKKQKNEGSGCATWQ